MGFRRWPGIFSVDGGGIADDNWLQSEPTNSPLDADERSTVTVDDVQRDAAAYLESTTAFSQQNKDKLVKPQKYQLAIMDINIDKLRIKGQGLACDAKANWDLRMSKLDAKRQSTNAKLKEIEKSTAATWNDVDQGAQSI